MTFLAERHLAPRELGAGVHWIFFFIQYKLKLSGTKEPYGNELEAFYDDTPNNNNMNFFNRSQTHEEYLFWHSFLTLTCI